MATEVATLRKTALNPVHHALHAKMVAFGGWEMPVEYRGIISEHLAVRTRVGLFDVSHMGEIEIRGQGALNLLQWVTSNDASKLVPGQALYSGLMTERGTFVDDLLVHKFADTHYFLCVNAANIDKDFQWIVQQNRFDSPVTNTSDWYTQLAVQGPRAAAVLARAANPDPTGIKYYRFTTGKIAGVDCLIARTGYTGEDGFEVYFDQVYSEKVWNAILEAGRPEGIVPCGLGARNTLRLEACFALYGHEIDDTTTPWEANLGWICKLDKGDFLGREDLVQQKAEGLRRRLVGFEMVERGIGRDGYPVLIDGREVGRVTSGCPAPYLKKNLGLAYVPVEHANLGEEISIQIRSTPTRARIVETPFYKRPKF